MKQSKRYGLIGISIPIIFVVTYLIMSTIRPEYSHLHKAISELGSLDAPNKWWWNIIGYITVGALISIFAIGLSKNVNPNGKGKLAFWGLFLSGIFMSLSGIFPGDFDDRTSMTMILHTIGSLGSFLFFLIAAFSYPKQFKKSDYWKKAINPSLILTILSIVSGFLRTGNTPGLGQRIGFGFYFLWIGYLAFLLFKQEEIKTPTNI
ncbi:MAG: DUF998 domain-containing protein [Bacteroidetes bacterium]|jgi:hypothetical membrane protein|nr:DUF998 domain-containing protein [Bacteroidota bacterium]MDF1865064.1 DUF998 domain-containing protein [Saprospiraceae bacterium]